MKKAIEPGMLCLIRGSNYNDGKIVTAKEFIGDQPYCDTQDQTTPIYHAATWIVEEEIYKPWYTVTLDKHSVPECNLFPLDNPGEDEEDSHSVRREISKIRKLEHHE